VRIEARLTNVPYAKGSLRAVADDGLQRHVGATLTVRGLVIAVEAVKIVQQASLCQCCSNRESGRKCIMKVHQQLG
jgi:hypothetical protein